MSKYVITTSLNDQVGTDYRSEAVDLYVKRVKLSLSMRGPMSGQDVTLYRNGKRALEHMGRINLDERVTTRLVALDSAPEDWDGK